MAYIIVTWDEQELDRRELTEPVVFGRSSECDVSIHDIHLSRRHCQIQPKGNGWEAVDLGSKNGTTIYGQALQSHDLTDLDVIRAGRMRIFFNEGAMPPADPSAVSSALGRNRPFNPNDTMSGTVTSFSLLESGEASLDGAEPGGVEPRPQPRTPAAYERDGVHSLVAAIASSSWDSIYDQNRQPMLAARPIPDQSAAASARARPARPRSPVDLSLQVRPAAESTVAAVSPATANMTTAPGELDALLVTADAAALATFATVTPTIPAGAAAPSALATSAAGAAFSATGHWSGSIIPHILRGTLAAALMLMIVLIMDRRHVPSSASAMDLWSPALPPSSAIEPHAAGMPLVEDADEPDAGPTPMAIAYSDLARFLHRATAEIDVQLGLKNGEAVGTSMSFGITQPIGRTAGPVPIESAGAELGPAITPEQAR
jgi:hypothetical protein